MDRREKNHDYKAFPILEDNCFDNVVIGYFSICWDQNIMP